MKIKKRIKKNAYKSNSFRQNKTEVKENKNKKSKKFTYVILVVLVVFLVYLTITNNSNLKSFSMIFLSIILEGLPFLLLGSFLASLIHLFVSEDLLKKIIPKNRFLAVIVASLTGLIFPVCECAIIPIIRRLVKKGMPMNVAITFLLSAPIINPIVLISTYYAFPNKPIIVFTRAAVGIFLSVLIGYFLFGIRKEIYEKEENKNSFTHRRINHNTSFASDCSCEHCNDQTRNKKSIISIFHHTTDEFFDIGKFFFMGVLFASLFQTFFPRSIILGIGNDLILSVVFMMAFAFLSSVCSEADAFIARTFLGQFTPGSIIAFLTYGPMIDLKNTFMLLHAFKRRFVVLLIIFITIENLIIAIVINLISILGVRI